MTSTVPFSAALTARANPADTPTLARIKKSAREFEEMFVAQMLQPMFDSVPTDGPFGGGQTEEMFRGMLVNEYAKQMTKSTPIGLADHMVRTLLQTQAAPATEGVQG
jgi:Rod binding domain-containing protein